MLMEDGVILVAYLTQTFDVNSYNTVSGLSWNSPHALFWIQELYLALKVWDPVLVIYQGTFFGFAWSSYIPGVLSWPYTSALTTGYHLANLSHTNV